MSFLMDTKFKFRSLWILCMLSCCMVSAQVPHSTLTVDEMKQLYLNEDSLLPICEKELSDYDLIETNRETCHILPNKDLRNAGGIVIPPSRFVVCHEKSMPEYLCWIGTRDDAEPKTSERLFKQLAKRYGELTLGDTLRAIPAKWFTGTLSYTGWLRPLGGTKLSATIDDWSVEEGVCSYDHINRRDTGMPYFNGTLRHDIQMLTKADSHLQGIVVSDGPKLKPSVRVWKDKVERWQEMYLLSRDVNRLCKIRTERDGALSYTLLISIDEKGKNHLHVIAPELSNEREKAALRELSEAIEQQPAGILRASWTYDGRLFPGIVVNARLLWRGWELTDAGYDYQRKRK